MSPVIEYIERKVTGVWLCQFAAIVLTVFGPAAALVHVYAFDPAVTLLPATAVLLVLLVPITKRLPEHKLEVLRVTSDENLDILLSKHPETAFGSWWRHRVIIRPDAVNRIRVAPTRSVTSLPDVRLWYWVRFESGSLVLDTWVPDGRKQSAPAVLREIGRILGIPVEEEGQVGQLHAYRYRKDKRQRTVPGGKWP